MRSPPNERLRHQARTPATAPKAGGQSRKKDPGLPRTQEPGTHTPERTCVLTRRKGSPDQLIRLALAPDGTVAPDVRARAPGRGAWICVARRELAAAAADGTLKSALQRAFKTGEVTVPVDLADRTEAALSQAALERLGMEARAGTLITGSDRIEAAARSGKVVLLLHADDAGLDGRKKLDQAWRVGGGAPRGVNLPLPRTILSLALGRENVVHLALNEPAAAARVLRAISRWRDFIDPGADLEGGDPASGTGSAEDIEGNK